MRGLADLAERHGSGSIRLTVWQNLIVADIPQASIPEFTKELAALGLSASASGIRAGLVACTGNGGCRYAASDTKGHALALAEHLESRLELDGPINIHLTGCPHSCAQHYAGDIGLLGTKVERGGEAVEGYHVLVGGGAGADRGLGREICRGVPFDEVKGLLERMLRVYLERRSGAGETFVMFTRRHSVEGLKRWFAIEDATMEN
jgi:ferredoxin-nitrite reductase